MNQQEIADALEQHRRWLDQDNDGDGDGGGGRADLSDTDLGGMDLTGVDLRQALLARVNLRDANLEGARLDSADLTEADLAGASLTDAMLTDARLANANLEHADLSRAKFLGESQLCGCNLFRTTLPESFEFQGLTLADEAARSVQARLVSSLMACIYSWLTIGSTTDLNLLTNASSVSFPFIDISLPIVGMYFVAPVLVAALFLSFYLHLAIFWERLALLPAIFPSGDKLTTKIYPSLFDSLINRQMFWLSRLESPTFVSRLNILMIRSGLDGLVFLTLFFYWLRYLPRHDPIGTTLHLAVLFAAFFAAWIFSIQMRNKLRMMSDSGEFARRSWQPALASLVLIALATFSVLVFRGQKISWGHFYADLGQRAVSTQNLNAEGKVADDNRAIIGAELRDMNLRFANLEDAFAVNATLRGSNLEGANLRRSDLRNVDLREAGLVGTFLQRAQFQKANLRKADMRRADLTEAELQEANLSQASLREAILARAQIDRANFSRAELYGATLNGAVGRTVDFSLARLNDTQLSMAELTGSNFFLTELRRAWFWKTKLQDSSLVLADARGANLSYAQLQGADLAQASFDRSVFKGADLSSSRLVFTRLNGADLLRARLQGADLSGAQLQGAELRGTVLAGARFRNAWMKATRLEGVDLAEVDGLSQKQLTQACLDDSTLLPVQFRSQKSEILAASRAYHLGTEACTDASQVE